MTISGRHCPEGTLHDYLDFASSIRQLQCSDTYGLPSGGLLEKFSKSPLLDQLLLVIWRRGSERSTQLHLSLLLLLNLFNTWVDRQTHVLNDHLRHGHVIWVFPLNPLISRGLAKLRQSAFVNAILVCPELVGSAKYHNFHLVIFPLGHVPGSSRMD